MIEVDGSCKKCDDYLKLQDDKKSCISPQCEEREKINKDGSCSKCDDYLILSEDKRDCVSP